MDGPMPSEMKGRLWFLYPIAAAVATVVYFASGHPSALYNLIGLSSPVLIVIAVRLHQPEQRAPWYLFALGQFLFIAGDIVYYNYAQFFGTAEIPYPSLGDVFYLSVYPCLAVGLLLLVRRRSPGRDWSSLIDSLMIAIAVGTLSWVFLIAPYWHDGESGLLTKLTSMAYPIMDLIVITVAIRLAIGAGGRSTSLRLMLAAGITLIVTDSLYGWSLLHEAYVPGSGYLELGWIAFYVMWGMAALHPSMRALSERANEREDRLTWKRLVLLAGAALMPPVLLIVEISRGDEVDLEVVLWATVVLFVLVVIRMAGLIRTQQVSAARERALREAGASFVTATSREGIHAAALEGIRAVAGPRSGVRICERADDGSFAVVSSSEDDNPEGSCVEFGTLADWKRERLLQHGDYRVPVDGSTMAQELSLDRPGGELFVAPLFFREALAGIIVVAAVDSFPRTVVDALRALSTQVALALESAALTQDLLRQQSEARFASLVKNSLDVVTVIEPDTTIRYASPSAASVLGMAPEQLEGTRFADMIHADDMTRVLAFLTTAGDVDGHTGLLEFRVRHANGSILTVETLRTNLLHDPNVNGIVLNTRDIGERKAFEEQLAHQAFHDSITGLANRALFRDRVLHAIERQQRDERPIAVLFMDLDDFKTINDSMGHAAGDLLLGAVADRLKECLRAADTAARLGGDEFAILLEDGGEGIQAVDVADRLMEVLQEPFMIDDKEVFVRASVGIAIANGELDGEVGAEELLRDADVAMYMAKEAGKGRYQVFEPAMHDTALKRLELKADLQRALEHGEFVLHYQPVIELASGAISGVEALIRWMHPARGMVPPLDFIPLAEETGLISRIGRWVLEEACRAGKALQDRFPMDPPLHMAVNLSARQLQRAEIVDEVRDILRDSGLEPSTLIIEITESVMMQDMDLSIARLTELKELGVQLAIDDFGTGYSSLNYVRRFPVDILKVDKSFIDGVSEGGESSALTAAVIELAGILNLKPVAEGIERADQLERLLEMHCGLGQGFLFAKPMLETDLAALLAERLAMAAEIEAVAQGGQI